VVSLLLDKGADPNYHNKELTPLVNAAMYVREREREREKTSSHLLFLPFEKEW
jgi:hypothetical protein